MNITVQCPSCSTSFPVDPAKVPDQGVHARCSVCTSVFFVAKPSRIEDAAPEPTRADVSPPDPEAELRTDGEDTEAHTGDEASAAKDDSEWSAEEPVAEADTGWSTEEPAAEAESPWSTEEPAAEAESIDVEAPDEWVFEREPELDPSSLDVEPMETVESSQEGFFGGPSGDDIERATPPGPSAGDMAADSLDQDGDIERGEPEISVEGGVGSMAAPEAPAAEPEGGTDAFFGGGSAAPVADEPEAAPVADEPEAAPDQGHVPDAVPTPSAAPAGFQFGRRDPHEKAQRLARVLVSDMIMYNPERHTRALEGGTLPQDFDDEIKRSWDEFVDQVGDEIARSTNYFSDALNEILARGEQLFQGSPPRS